MNFPVIKSAGYVLVHAPDMLIHNGTTQTTERLINPDSEYLKNIRTHLRPFEEVVNYAPNQVYIGNLHPQELKSLGKEWINLSNEGNRKGKMGEILSEDEFIVLMKICDSFDLVVLEENFLEQAKLHYFEGDIYIPDDLTKITPGVELNEIEKFVSEEGAEPIYYEDKLVGCVKKAHDIDPNLTSHIMFENIVTKASGVAAFRNLISQNKIDPDSIQYVIECSEEACGDMNQRGGGNFSKAICEAAGIKNATGCDIRGFCAAPTHALLNGASLVQSGIFDNVVIVAGGATAKLGMNGKDHMKKGLPLLEDVLGAFAVLISKNDLMSPIIRTDLVGRHTVGTGSSPQAVMTALISHPLEKGGLKVTDVDKYSVEMQNPEITKPAGAGDVPESNYKMIGALGVKRGDLKREELTNFIDAHGMPGWAPTQGHIPSGIPYLGFAIQDLSEGDLNRIMVVGKGSLFLGRMTNQFDGVSIIIERNPGKLEEKSVSKEEINRIIAKAMRDVASKILEDQEA